MPAESATLLFVDDDDANRRLLSWIFRNEGFRVLEAGSGAEALRLSEEKPDLVVLDVNLPDLNGFEVCRLLKARPATASTPVLHVSAVYVNSGDRSEGLESGADGYLVKPVEPRKSWRRCAASCASTPPRRPPAPPPSSGAPPSTPSAIRFA